ncbi:hypothetical protein PGT21_017208 [Puccinia graminis f. sp. tritici]|uniref:Uncharacterized protein n=1 Tax=Puccinia graminis f. sp. tritici TaxID=56615 RepID=A0A5B0PJI3_PUCGR|nr:hypothetical protein PGT21_017208 [Puccinia graminis f. sp. tritici]
MGSEPGLTDIPVITIQHDFPEVISDIKNEVCLAEDIWISCYRSSSSSSNTTETRRSVHGKVRVSSNVLDHPQQTQNNLNDLISLEGRDGVECRWADDASFSQLALIVTCEPLSIPPTTVSFPSQTLARIQPNGIECMDVAGEWLVTGGKNGQVRVDRWATQPADTLGHHDELLCWIGKGHVSDLTSCQFFPSGKVILTTSIDMSARIYSIDRVPSDDHEEEDSRTPTRKRMTMLNPRTFGPPHGRGVIGAGIMGKGREIVTGCRDGKLRVWNVGESKVVAEAEMSSSSSAEVLALEVGEKRFLDRTGEVLTPEADHNRAFFLLLGLSSGALDFVDLPSLKPIKLRTPLPGQSGAPIDVVAMSGAMDMIAYGTRTGTVALATLVWHRSSPSSPSCCSTTSSSSETAEDEIESLSVIPIAIWQRTSAGINSLAFSQDDQTLLVAGHDGLPYRVSIVDAARPKVLQELAGYNCDPVAAIRASFSASASHHSVFTAGKDGSIKIWNL